jgi:hypothetical protein
VADLLTRLVPRTDREALEHARWIVVAGASGAVTAAGICLALLGGLMVLLWAGVPHTGTGMVEAMKFAGVAWLAAQGVEVSVAAGEFGVRPLGITLLPVYVMFRTGAWASRLADVEDLRAAGICAAGFAAGYGVLAAIVGAASGSDGFRPHPFDALSAGAALAFLVGGLGVLRGSGLLDDLLARLPSGALRALPAAGAALLVLVAGGALLTGVALVLQLERVGEVSSALAVSWFESAGLLAVCAAFAPNAIVWSAALLTGPGFSLGTGTQVGLDGAVLSSAPALPLLAALPSSGPFHPAAYGLLVVPAVAGVIAGLLVERAARAENPADPAYRTALWAGVAGVLAGITLGALAALSGGSAGGRLADVGPTGWQVGLLASAEVAAAAAAGAWLAAWWSRREGRASS